MEIDEVYLILYYKCVTLPTVLESNTNYFSNTSRKRNMIRKNYFFSEDTYFNFYFSEFEA